MRFDTTPGEEVILVVLAESRITEFEYGGQQIAIRSPGSNPGTPNPPAQQQRVAVASLDLSSSSKDMFVEDDGVFQTVVFKEASSKKKPLVTAIRLAHR